MARKRATSEHSFVVGVDKPCGMTSHDVVDACRRIYGERRIGHAGTLDPAATGALVVCVGPAARLDRYLSGHDKSYEFTCVFGTQTDTDDAEGSVVATGHVPARLRDAEFASDILRCMEGPSMQLPPAYSSIKLGGKTAHKEARAGRPLMLAPRAVTVHALELLEIEQHEDGGIVWRVRAHVSAGTYIRALARDLGAAAGTYAHVGLLRRLRCGLLDVAECVAPDALAADPFRYLVDPLLLLGFRVLFVEGGQAHAVASGAPLASKGREYFAYRPRVRAELAACSCTSGIERSIDPPTQGELFSVVSDNRLVAIYAYDQASGLLKSSCGFAIGVRRGGDL